MSAAAHLQYCRINWIPDHSLITTDFKSASTTERRCRDYSSILWHYDVLVWNKQPYVAAHVVIQDIDLVSRSPRASM